MTDTKDRSPFFPSKGWGSGTADGKTCSWGPACPPPRGHCRSSHFPRGTNAAPPLRADRVHALVAASLPSTSKATRHPTHKLAQSLLMGRSKLQPRARNL